MRIKIEKLSVRNCGPIQDFSQSLNDLNLIYSKNEKGKSFLVEFFIRCLFKSKSNWGYLRELGSGKVTLSGLDNNPIEFTQSKGKKLEDYFEKDPRGLPTSLVKLLVVKKGETEIVKDEAGIDKDTIKDILSPRRILDSIENKISSTVKSARITDNDLDIRKQGEGKDYHTNKEELRRVDEVINQFVSEYEQGKLKDLKLQEDGFKQKKELLIKAKKHKAYKLSLEIGELEKNVKQMPEDVINKLKSLVTDYDAEKGKYGIFEKELREIKIETENLSNLTNQKDLLVKAKKYQAYLLSKELKNKESELNAIPEEELNKIEQNISDHSNKKEEKNIKFQLVKELEEKSKHYNWLKSAKGNYQRFLTAPTAKGKISYFLLFVAILTIISALISVLFDQKIIGIILILFAVLSAAVYLIKYKKSMSVYKQSKEFESIRAEFKKQFNIELRDFTQLESLFGEQEKNFNQLEVHQSDLNRLVIQVENLKRLIEEGLKNLRIDFSIESEWSNNLSNLKAERKKILEDYGRTKIGLEKLEVEESEYELKDPGVKFNKSELEKIETELARLKGLQTKEVKKNDELKDLEDHLKESKQAIETEFKKITEEELSEDKWKERVNNLEKSRNDILTQIKDNLGELRGLGINESGYEKENPGEEFAQSKLDQVENELKMLDEKVKEEEERLSQLKTSICSITEADISTNWTDLIDILYLKKEEVKKEFQEIESNIISGIKVHEIIEEFHQEEDIKLLEGLNSQEVSEYLSTLTGKYKKLSFEEAGIAVSDDYDNFLLKDLSTGAKEQVMLALRIGFLKRLMKQDSAFLILDDAFQHSDYTKRPILVDTLFNLANNGWQIIYFTMDDHIKGLFNENGKTMKERYREFTLN